VTHHRNQWSYFLKDEHRWRSLSTVENRWNPKKTGNRPCRPSEDPPGGPRGLIIKAWLTRFGEKEMNGGKGASVQICQLDNFSGCFPRNCNYFLGLGGPEGVPGGSEGPRRGPGGGRRGSEAVFLRKVRFRDLIDDLKCKSDVIWGYPGYSA